MSTELGFDHGRDAVTRTQGICAPREQERGDIDVKRLPALRVSVDLNIDRMPKQRPTFPATVLHVMAGIEQFPQPNEIFEFDRLMRC